MRLAATIEVQVKNELGNEPEIEKKELVLSETEDRTKIEISGLSYQKIVLDVDSLADLTNALNLLDNRLSRQ